MERNNKQKKHNKNFLISSTIFRLNELCSYILTNKIFQLNNTVFLSATAWNLRVTSPCLHLKYMLTFHVKYNNYGSLHFQNEGTFNYYSILYINHDSTTWVRPTAQTFTAIIANNHTGRSDFLPITIPRLPISMLVEECMYINVNLVHHSRLCGPSIISV